MRIQSINDVITNSSTEIYQEATQRTVNTVKDIISVILKVSGSNKSCDDLFTVSIDYEDMLEDYFEYCLNLDIKDEYIDIIDEIRDFRDEQGRLISDSEAYKELVETGLVGSVLPTIEKFVDNFESGWKGITTKLSIIPKGETNQTDINILGKINDLFYVTAYYN